jgi:hypothetical protein
MRLVTLFLIAALAASTVDAASCQKIDGTIVDPIMAHYNDEFFPHPYSGANLEPYVDLGHVPWPPGLCPTRICPTRT